MEYGLQSKVSGRLSGTKRYLFVHPFFTLFLIFFIFLAMPRIPWCAVHFYVRPFLTKTRTNKKVPFCYTVIIGNQRKGKYQMSIKRIFIAMTAIFAVSAVFADNSSVTSKKYVDDLMSGYQGKLPGSGANKLMIYDDETGIGEKSIETTLGENATSVPTVSAVKTGLDGKQDTINGTPGYVMTGTGNPGEVGEKPIYSANTNYTDSLVTAETVNTGVINAVNSSLIRVNEQGAPSDSGTLWEIQDDLVAINANVPYGYTELQYVDMNSGSYLLTNIKPSYDGHYEIDFKTTTLNSSSGATTYLGARQAGGDYGGLRLARITSEVFRVYGFGSYKDSTVTATGDTRYKFVWDNRRATLTTGSTTVFNNTFTDTGACPYSLVINGWNTSGTVTPGLEGVYVYSFKAWNAQGELVANYVPATYNNTVGFYDTVSKTFKTATSGTFTAGPAVSN